MVNTLLLISSIISLTVGIVLFYENVRFLKLIEDLTSVAENLLNELQELKNTNEKLIISINALEQEKENFK